MAGGSRRARLAPLFLFLLAESISPAIPVLALDPARPITHYAKDVWRRENGLPQDSVNAVMQSADGYLWLGTDEGLARFDGVDFKIFDRTNTPAFSRNHVTSLCQSAEGSLWIGTNGGGLILMSAEGSRAILFEGGLAPNQVHCLLAGPDGDVWVGTAQGLSRFRADGSPVRPPPGLPAGVPVRALSLDGAGGILVAAQGSLFHLKGEQVTTLPPLPEDDVEVVTRLLKDAGGTLWVGTTKGLYEALPDGWKRYGTVEGLTSERISVLCQDSKGSLWIGTPLGLNRFYKGVIRRLTIKEGLPDNDIRSIFEDREENLWVGTNGGGLVRMKDRSFSALSTTCGLCSDTVWSIFESPERQLWIGTEGGLACFTEGRLDTFGTNQGLPSDVIRCVWVDHRGDVWAGTGGAGLARRHGGRWTVYRAPSPLPNDTVLALREDREGRLWVGTNGGLSVFDGTGWRTFTLADGLPNERVRAILEDGRGALWIGTYGGGLALYDQGAIRTFGPREGLAGENVWCLHETQDGALWIGTGSGLSRRKNGQFKTLTEGEGLFSDVIYDILEDDAGNFWMSCNKGVSRVPIAEVDSAMDKGADLQGVVTFGVSDGMSASECNGGSQPSGWRSANGKLWFPTVRGAMVVNPKALKLDRRPPQVVIERFSADNHPFAAGAGVTDVPPGLKNLEIGYAGLSFASPEKVSYRYRLTGFQDEWVHAGTRRVAYFTKVPPGRYTFEVQAQLGNGPWSVVPAVLDLKLAPFFYQTWWFLLLCLAAAGVSVLGIYRGRVRQLRTRQVQLESLVRERTKDLEDANERLERLSTIDPLTGVANRRSLGDHLERQWRQLFRSGAPLSVVMVDLDAFKAFNDTYGHQLGDDCLLRVANVLRGQANRAGDLVSRYGGEEFAVVLSDTSPERAEQMAEAMRAEVEGLGIEHRSSPAAPVVTISAGVAGFAPSSERSWRELLGEADKALYRAKKAGRNRVLVANPREPAGS